tara:strand:+ start:1396 stop:2049 length:654 start_codon:yes stop_codon:yes gene_type:complete
MTTNTYYRKYKKIKKPKVKDDSVLERIESILNIPFVYGNTKQFLESIYEQYNKNGNLTEAQLNAVNKIDKKYSPETIADYEEWKLKYDNVKKEIAKICAFYYKNNPPYFKELSEQVLNDLDFVPTEKQFNSMCKNKFTQKVVNETRSEPKFLVGQLVQGRKNAPIKIRDFYFSIIEIGAKPVVSAAKGAKVYTLLPLGKTQVVDCEERFLKKAQKMI